MARSDRNVGMAAKQAALKALGARLREARSGISLTQEAVAEKLGVSSQTARNWEAGRTEPSRFDKERLAALYGKPMEWFFGQDEPAAPPVQPPRPPDPIQELLDLVREMHRMLAERLPPP